MLYFVVVTTVLCCAACVADFVKNAKLLCTRCIPEVRNAPELIVSHGCTLDPAPGRSPSQLWKGIYIPPASTILTSDL